MYTERFYRQWVDRQDLKSFQVCIGQSDLFILCDGDLQEEAQAELARVRRLIERYIDQDPGFADALEPYPVPDHAPEAIRGMSAAATKWDVGPMAAVAGAVAESVGRSLLKHCRTVIVENGGDIFACSPRPLLFRLYAGEASPFSNRIVFEIECRDGIGVCTSSGLVGPSLSFGRADAVVAVAPDTREADAAATALANRVDDPADIETLYNDTTAGGLAGLIACAGDRIGFRGDFQLRKA